MRFPSQSVNWKLVALSHEILGLVDPTNPKILKVSDSKTGK